MKNIYVIFDPTRELEELAVPDPTTKASYENNNEDKHIGHVSPFIEIGGCQFDEGNTVSCEISIGDFLPTLRLTVYDPTGMLQQEKTANTNPKIKVFIRSNNRDFKPIRQDYRQTSCRDRDGFVTFTAVLDISELFQDRVASWGNTTSSETLQKIAKELRLGFATNDGQTQDRMTRICPNVRLIDFIEQDLMMSTYKDDKSFFRAFIDQYYYLNFVEVNSLIDHEEKMERVTQTMEMSIPDIRQGDAEESTLRDLFLHNIVEAGQTNFFGEFSYRNNVGEKTLDYGNKLYLQYYDKKDEQYKEFFFKPLVTEGSSRRTIQDKTDYVRSLNVAEQRTASVHPNFYAAKVLNRLNIEQLEVFTLDLTLTKMNPALRCYLRLPVFVQLRSALGDVAEQETREIEGLNDKVKLDPSVSGFYTVTQMTYVYNIGGGVSQRLKLCRREI